MRAAPQPRMKAPEFSVILGGLAAVAVLSVVLSGGVFAVASASASMHGRRVPTRFTTVTICRSCRETSYLGRRECSVCARRTMLIWSSVVGVVMATELVLGVAVHLGPPHPSPVHGPGEHAGDSEPNPEP